MSTEVTHRLVAVDVLRRATANKVLLSFLTLIAVWAIAFVSSPSIGSAATTTYLLQTAAFLGIVALGQTLVVVMGGIDLSVSGVVALSAVVCAEVATTASPGVAVLVALGVSALVGVFNALGVSYLGLPPIVMTLASATILTGALMIYTDGSPKSASIPLLSTIANGSFGPLPWALIVWMIIAACTYWVLHLTRTGRYAFSIGSNPRASRASGVPVIATNLLLYAGCSLFAGVSGLILLGFTGTSSLTMGEPYQLLSIAAVVLGGTSILGGRGHALGTISGAMLLTLLTSLLASWSVPQSGRQMMLGALIIGLLLVYSREKAS